MSNSPNLSATLDVMRNKITKKRIVDDMNYSLNLVSTVRRVEWIKKNFKIDEVIYMGDGIFDHYVMKKVGYSIAPANADINAKRYANFVTKRSGGDRAVAEACIHILKKFFKIKLLTHLAKN